MKKITIIILSIIFFILTFFDSLVVPIPHINKWLQLSCFLSILLFISLFLSYKEALIKNIKQAILCKNSSIKIYLILISYILIQTIVYGSIGKINFISSCVDILAQYFVTFLLCYIVTFFIIKKVFKTSFAVKIIYSTIYLILILGIVDFISYNFNIPILQNLLQYANNASVIVNKSDAFIKSYAYGAYRVQSIYVEPATYAEHLFIFMPFIYFFTKLKTKIYKNSILNNFIKHSYIPLLWINIILTQSPIWLCASLCLLIFMYYKHILKFITKHLILILIFILLVINANIALNIDNTYISRITTVIQSTKNINLLIESEQSLGTRISCVLNLIHIGLSEPVFGIGHSNIKPRMIEQIQNGKSIFYVTPEMYFCIIQKESPSFQDPTLVNFFVRYGIIALILYLCFVLKLRRNLIILYRNGNPYERTFAKALTISIICIIITGCYDIGIANYPCHFIIGLSIGMEQLLMSKYRIRYGTVDEIKNKNKEQVDNI